MSAHYYCFVDKKWKEISLNDYILSYYEAKKAIIDGHICGLAIYLDTFVYHGIYQDNVDNHDNVYKWKNKSLL